MGWARLDDNFHDHPKLIGLSLEALGLWTKCFTWAHRHHGSSIILGHLPEGLAQTFAGSRAAKLVKELEMHRLWDIEDGLGGWVIHDYVEYLPASERPSTSLEVSNARAEAGKRGAEARWGKASESQTDGKLPSTPDGKPMAPTRPDPTREESNDSSPREGKKPDVRIPANWAPTAAHFERAKTSGVDIAREAELFRLHAETHDRHAANWNAAFTTWLTKSKPAVPAGRNPDAWMNL